MKLIVIPMGLPGEASTSRVTIRFHSSAQDSKELPRKHQKARMNRRKADGSSRVGHCRSDRRAGIIRHSYTSSHFFVPDQLDVLFQDRGTQCEHYKLRRLY